MPSVSYVYNADIYPFSAIVSIDVTFADGTHSRGTGAVVGVNDVLTASHVVDNDPVHGAVKSITVTPGVSGQASIYSEYSASHRAFRNIDPDGDGFACGWDPAPFLFVASN